MHSDAEKAFNIKAVDSVIQFNINDPALQFAKRQSQLVDSPNVMAKKALYIPTAK